MLRVFAVPQYIELLQIFFVLFFFQMHLISWLARVLVFVQLQGVRVLVILKDPSLMDITGKII